MQNRTNEETADDKKRQFALHRSPYDRHSDALPRRDESPLACRTRAGSPHAKLLRRNSLAAAAACGISSRHTLRSRLQRIRLTVLRRRVFSVPETDRNCGKVPSHSHAGRLRSQSTAWELRRPAGKDLTSRTWAATLWLNAVSAQYGRYPPPPGGAPPPRTGPYPPGAAPAAEYP